MAWSRHPPELLPPAQYQECLDDKTRAPQTTLQPLGVRQRQDPGERHKPSWRPHLWEGSVVSSGAATKCPPFLQEAPAGQPRTHG